MDMLLLFKTRCCGWDEKLFNHCK